VGADLEGAVTGFEILILGVAVWLIDVLLMWCCP
jgi:hypothetical protein